MSFTSLSQWLFHMCPYVFFVLSRSRPVLKTDLLRSSCTSRIHPCRSSWAVMNLFSQHSSEIVLWKWNTEKGQKYSLLVRLALGQGFYLCVFKGSIKIHPWRCFTWNLDVPCHREQVLSLSFWSFLCSVSPHHPPKTSLHFHRLCIWCHGQVIFKFSAAARGQEGSSSSQQN